MIGITDCVEGLLRFQRVAVKVARDHNPAKWEDEVGNVKQVIRTIVDDMYADGEYPLGISMDVFEDVIDVIDPSEAIYIKQDGSIATIVDSIAKNHTSDSLNVFFERSEFWCRAITEKAIAHTTDMSEFIIMRRYLKMTLNACMSIRKFDEGATRIASEYCDHRGGSMYTIAKNKLNDAFSDRTVIYDSMIKLLCESLERVKVSGNDRRLAMRRSLLDAHDSNSNDSSSSTNMSDEHDFDTVLKTAVGDEGVFAGITYDDVVFWKTECPRIRADLIIESKNMFCGISKLRCVDPILASDGVIYDKANFEAHVNKGSANKLLTVEAANIETPGGINPDYIITSPHDNHTPLYTANVCRLEFLQKKITLVGHPVYVFYDWLESMME